MTSSRRLFGLCAGAALVATTLPGAAFAATKSTAYVAVSDGNSSAYLIDWLPKSKARLANNNGAQSGVVTDDGTQKVITLNTPISYTFDNWDDCGEEIRQRSDTQQVVVRDHTGGVTEFVEIGATTNIGGCQDGLSVPFGGLTDAGRNLNRLAMAARPPVTDLVPGTQIAGFSEDVMLPGETAVAHDVVTMQSGSMQFHASGHTVPAAFNADQWLVLDLPSGQRAYTRLALDAKTGGETWLMADWSAGKPQRIEELMVVKPTAGAGFGTVAQASRMWNSGLFIESRTPFYFYLYKNGTGERVQKDLDLGTESRTPIPSWGFDGLNLVQQRPFGPGTRDRTWAPLSNTGKFHWVMESETAFDGSDTFVLVKPRVNYYLDTGKAVPPANGLKASRGFVSMHEKSKIAR
ncbi:hypothetical protein [Ideonella sp.]|uniref:hypothetical protein n=1 Tax=Ideonella sp. TaxID=1929293 RepID=UPI0035B44D23